MKTIERLLLVLLALAFNSYCYANLSTKYSYDSKNGLISAESTEGSARIIFHEKDEGNSSYYFDFFGNKPAIVHDNNSLNSYTSYALLDYRDENFYIDCIYVDLNSSQNGIHVKEGRCGLNSRILKDAGSSAKIIDGITNDVISSNNKIITSYFINNKVRYLPVVTFRNSNKYIYKVYETKEDLVNGKYVLFFCDSEKCGVYDENTWVVIKNNKTLDIELKVLNKSNDNNVLENAKPEKVISVKGVPTPPFMVSSDKAYFYDSFFNKKKSYLVKNDKFTLLSIDDEGKWCNVRYINEKNKETDGNMNCTDLNI